ncbi:HTH domain-containing protein, partial [Listeria booriae]|uniref:helix-turn-helix domain-containing protein n=1 Tax=Listeria booriae TaxID=1552123 RepID=UPI0016246427
MNHFCLRLIPDKKVHRHILLIEQIAKARYAITLDEISDTLNTSLRTLKRDVQEIEDMEEKLIIKHSASMLEITDNELVDFVLAE